MFFSLTLSWMHMEPRNWHYFLLHWRAFSSHYHLQSTYFSVPEIQVCYIRVLYHIRAISSTCEILPRKKSSLRESLAESHALFLIRSETLRRRLARAKSLAKSLVFLRGLMVNNVQKLRNIPFFHDFTD